MVLNQIRSRIQPIMDSIGRALGRSGITPDILTVVGFFLGVCAGFWFALRPGQQYVAALLILASGLLDMLDGAVARATRSISTIGSFHDSTLDRLSETAIYAGIVFAGYGVSPLFVLLTAAISLLVSYVRAKGESLSIKMSGIGVGERAERLIVLVVFALAGYIGLGIYLVLLLAIITFVQRYIYVARRIGRNASVVS